MTVLLGGGGQRIETPAAHWNHLGEGGALRAVAAWPHPGPVKSGSRGWPGVSDSEAGREI